MNLWNIRLAKLQGRAVHTAQRAYELTIISIH